MQFEQKCGVPMLQLMHHMTAIAADASLESLQTYTQLHIQKMWQSCQHLPAVSHPASVFNVHCHVQPHSDPVS